ncbi:hypothetical protein E4U34_004522 [Claviceps purpurea]|nr:hypothetical protein E4U34_004522 [Claviceps purpurea]
MQSLLQTAVHRLSHSELLTQYTFSSGNQFHGDLSTIIIHQPFHHPQRLYQSWSSMRPQPHYHASPSSPWPGCQIADLAGSLVNQLEMA